MSLFYLNKSEEMTDKKQTPTNHRKQIEQTDTIWARTQLDDIAGGMV